MIVIHRVPNPVMDGPEMADVQTATCGMRLPRHRYKLPARPERDGHYWHTKPSVHLQRPDLAHTNLAIRLCDKCGTATKAERDNVAGEPLENIRHLVNGGADCRSLIGDPRDYDWPDTI